MKKLNEYPIFMFIILLIVILVISIIVIGILNYNTLIFSNYFGDNVGIILYNKIAYYGITYNIGFIFKIIFNSRTLAYNFTNIIIFVFTGIVSFYYFKTLIDARKTFSLFVAMLFTIIILIAPLRLWYTHEWFSYANWGLLILFLFMFINIILTNKVIFVIGASFIYGILLLEGAYLGVMLFFILIPLSIYYLFINYRHKKLSIALKNLVIFAVLCIVFSLPALKFLALPNPNLTQENTSVFEFYKRDEESRWAYSARPWHYLLPDINTPLIGDSIVKLYYKIWATKPYYLTEPFFPKEHTLYLGIGLIFLSLITLYITYFKRKNLNTYSHNSKYKYIEIITHYSLSLKQHQLVTIFLIIFLSSIVLSMPPYIAINNIKLPFPSYYIYEYLPQLRAYARFGTFAFIANASIACIGLSIIIKNLDISTQKIKKHHIPLIFFLIVSLIILFDFSGFTSKKSISPTPLPPYKWLSEQTEQFGYLEIPRRADYTDRLYKSTSGHNKTILNQYLLTPPQVESIENSLYAEEFAKPDILWCGNFLKLGGKYIFLHDKELNKQKVVEEFLSTKQVTPPLKVAIAESWGYPIWGNHVTKTDKELFKEQRDKDLKNLLIQDSKFTLIKEFTNQDIIDSRPNKNFSADKFDAIAIFEINEEYCKSKGF